MENRRWHLIDLAQHPNMVCNLSVGIQQHPDGQLVPGGFEDRHDREDRGQADFRITISP